MRPETPFTLSRGSHCRRRCHETCLVLPGLVDGGRVACQASHAPPPLRPCRRPGGDPATARGAWRAGSHAAHRGRQGHDRRALRRPRGTHRRPDVGRNAPRTGARPGPARCRLGAMVLPSHHLYVHVPFCRLVCAYCDFVTVGGRGTEIPRYVAALEAELALRPADGELATIYFGGGTPSLLPAGAVADLVAAARARWAGRPAEITLEANPSARESPDWAGLRAAGINRISLGVQSLRDLELATLTRGHTGAAARAAYTAVRAARFETVSVDLIYSIPGQSLADW